MIFRTLQVTYRLKCFSNYCPNLSTHRKLVEAIPKISGDHFSLSLSKLIKPHLSSSSVFLHSTKQQTAQENEPHKQSYLRTHFHTPSVSNLRNLCLFTSALSAGCNYCRLIHFLLPNCLENC